MTDDRPYISCEALIDFLEAYHAGELPAEQRGEFDRHLAVCPDCKDYLRTYEKTIDLCKKSAAAGNEKAALEDVPEDLIRAILKSRKS